ncbi:MAG: hypothetical protein DRR06_08535, partial [Gammaproteobacteria bacterium]
PINMLVIRNLNVLLLHEAANSKSVGDVLNDLSKIVADTDCHLLLTMDNSVPENSVSGLSEQQANYYSEVEFHVNQVLTLTWKRYTHDYCLLQAAEISIRKSPYTVPVDLTCLINSNSLKISDPNSASDHGKEQWFEVYEEDYWESECG